MAVTLKMVADAAGVSIRTAGRALRGDGPVKPEVAERVRAAARQFAYVPNVAARNLRVRTSRIVGLISSGAHCEAWQTRLRAIEEQLRANELHTLLGGLPDDFKSLEQLLRDWAGVVQYVIFSHWNKAWDAEKLLHFPMRFLFLDCDPESDQFDRLLTDRSRGVEQAVLAFLAGGRRRIAHVGGNTAGRSAGFDAAIQQARQPVVTMRIPVDALELADGYNAGAALMTKQADAVFFDTDRMALGFYRYAHEHGIRIPEDIAVAGFDNDTAGAFAIPALTSVAHPIAEAVAEAVAIITDGEERIPETVIFPSRLICRESIG